MSGGVGRGREKLLLTRLGGATMHPWYVFGVKGKSGIFPFCNPIGLFIRILALFFSDHFQ
jgi:hypothetical protein